MHRDTFPGKKRYSGLAGSSDALAISRLAVESRAREGENHAGEHRALAVLTANALDAGRLLEEIAWFAPQLRTCLLPDWETLPYDNFSPHHDLVSERLATLYRIQRGDFDVVVVPVVTALVRLCPPSYLASYTFFLRQGERLDADALRRQLALAGYSAVAQVMTPGEFCFRGGIVDLYPMGAAVPYRLDLDDDVVETIRTFDVDTQRSLYTVKDVRLLPAREFPLDEAGRTKFRGRWRELFEGDPSKRRLYKDVSSGVPAAGVEYYLPLFFDALATVFDYLPEASSLVLHRDVAGAIQAFWRDTQSRYTMMGGDSDRPLLPPAQLFVSAEEFFTRAKAYPRIDILDTPDAEHEQPLSAAILPSLSVDRRAKDPLAALKQFIAGSGLRILLSAESPGRRETMASYLTEYGLQFSVLNSYEEFQKENARLALTVSPLSNGFLVPVEGWAIVTEAELYAGTVRRRGRGPKTQTSVEGMLRDLSELKVGDPVVHAQHGIGRYGGLVNLDLGEGMTEFLLLAYDGGDKLYVPVSQLEVISRYSGAQPEEAPLHKLGSGQWDKARTRAAKQVRDTAAELLDLYAKRAARQGHPFKVSQHDLDAFADGFGFEETVDQAAAITAVGADMISGKPMDRLICGDVGFGKTEVALRAAFIAVADRKQVALLCPTTLLVEQHFQTFADRFADWPVRIGELSRFNTGKQTTEALKKISSGELDIVIGTHKLLSKDVKFERLGLVIIDEEHRFGVHQKETLKRLRAEVDVLTLTATPIPRTLALSLEGLRDFSVIATAPERRLAIKTFVAPHSDGLIREAVLRELRRGGQVYYLHNEVDTIEHAHDKLARLLPEARLAVAHGQMRERELERVMREFTQQRHNVLLCSTIIETGIDNPNANTMVIHRADRFGLAQLHQLRGRVGRSHHQAYAYLMIPSEESLGKQAAKRLEAIQMMEQLGSGFYLAMHDLEIRGAGEVLGESQSGQIQEVGFDLYTRMLERAVRALRDGKAIDLDQPLAVATEIKLHFPALLPETYCHDVHERLTLYKRLANCNTREELELMREELVDRFGLLPDPAKVLLDSHLLRLLAAPLGIARVDATHEALLLQFQKDSPVDRDRIVVLLQKRKNLRLAGPDRLRLEAKMAEWPLRVQAAKDLLGALAA